MAGPGRRSRKVSRTLGRERGSEVAHARWCSPPQGLASREVAPVYARRRPEATTLYAVVRDNLETLYGAVDDGALGVSTVSAVPPMREALLVPVDSNDAEPVHGMARPAASTAKPTSRGANLVIAR